MKYTPVIGLEVHVELKTKSKMFCGCSADLWRVPTSQQGSSRSEGSYFGPAAPNTHCCPVCLGMPGALPVPNKKAIEWCVMIGLALNCEIPLFSKFDRKNYFYPDLPKGYQISQYDKPFAINGSLKLKVKSEKLKVIRIRRVHMEEDTARLVHQSGISNFQFPISNDESYSLIDFNRSGVPLVEIVTEPDFESVEEVLVYLKKLQQIVRYLGVSNADMERGDMRLEPNISLRPSHPELVSGSRKGEMPKQVRHDNGELPNYKVEVKNINSFRFVDRAIAYEIARQSELLEKGETPAQETRGYNEAKNKTLPQRSKEEAHDYRYFPEPDIPPVRWTGDQIAKIKDQIGELPDTKMERFQKEYQLPPYDAELLTREKETADFFEEAVKVATSHEPRATSKIIANWIINKKVDPATVLPAQLIQQILQATMTVAIDENKLEEIIKKVLLDNQKAVSDYKSGKEAAMMFLIGQVMREAKTKLDTNRIKELLKKLIYV